jgi:hypothetical protein
MVEKTPDARQKSICKVKASPERAVKRSYNSASRGPTHQNVRGSVSEMRSNIQPRKE